jgi:hypothetical protein
MTMSQKDIQAESWSDEDRGKWDINISLVEKVLIETFFKIKLHRKIHALSVCQPVCGNAHQPKKAGSLSLYECTLALEICQPNCVGTHM